MKLFFGIYNNIFCLLLSVYCSAVAQRARISEINLGLHRHVVAHIADPLRLGICYGFSGSDTSRKLHVTLRAGSIPVSEVLLLLVKKKPKPTSRK